MVIFINNRNSSLYKQYLFWFFLIFMTVFILKNPYITADSMIKGLNLCVKTVVPSLFPFFVISGLITKSGLGQFIGNKIGVYFEKIFGIGRHLAYVFILGQVCGFPVGAKTTSELYSAGLCTEDEAQRLICLCNNTGPAFIFGTVSTLFWQKPELGIYFYLSQLLSCTAVGLILNSTQKDREISSYCKKTPAFRISDVITSSLADGVFSILTVSSFVLFFCVFSNMLSVCINSIGNKLNINLFLIDIVATLLIEITGGINLLSSTFQGNFTEIYGLCATAFAIGWGGVSVYLQVLYFTSKYQIPSGKYPLYKFLQGILCSLFFLIFYSILNF